MKQERIMLGGGCFWCTEAVFKMLKGILSVEPGYAGGRTQNPTYEQVSGANTGHAEVIKIEYNPEEISLDDILTVFFASHDPTTVNRQGNDIGEQYRSIVLYATDGQKKAVEHFISELNSSSEHGSPIVTQVQKGGDFYPAEDYHRNYYERNKGQPYCQVVINPKLKKVKEKFAQLLK